ncbi:MAG: PDZ domain-containing protein [Spirosomataceae bacterium]
MSPNGKLLSTRFVEKCLLKKQIKKKSRSINVSNHAFRDIEPTWLNDSTLLFSSMTDGNFDIYLVRSADTTQRNIFKSLKHEIIPITKTAGDETALTVSPDGKKIAYVRGRGTFVVSDIDAKGKLSNEKILSDSWDAPNGIAWSHDNKWLAYAISDLYYNQEIFIQAADNSTKPVNVSMHPRTDGRPFWSADGSKLGFISARSAGRSADVWFVWLKKEDWEKETRDWQEKDTPTEIPSAKGGNDKKAPKPIQIDFDRIHERIVQVTNFPGDESNLVISKDGETFYYTTNSSTSKGRDLYSIKWDGTGLKEITKGGANPNGITMDKEGKYLYYRRLGSLGRIDVKTSLTETLPFVAKMKIDYIAERTQVFEEAWRTIRDGFYDPKFHGYNWVKLHDKYKERCINASTSNDFRDMFNLLLGEINSSHMGLTVGDRADTQKETTGLLGAELVPVANGVKITHVFPDTPADKASSKLDEGDVILSVNGEAVSENTNFHALMNTWSTRKFY